MPRPADWKRLTYKAIVANCAKIILRNSCASITRTSAIGKNTLKSLRLLTEAAGLKERRPHPTRASDVLENDLLERTSRVAYQTSEEEFRRRSEHPDIGHAKVRILQRVARGLPINVFERRLIAGDLPPGL